MANYNSSYTGQQIDNAIGKVLGGGHTLNLTVGRDCEAYVNYANGTGESVTTSGTYTNVITVSAGGSGGFDYTEAVGKFLLINDGTMYVQGSSEFYDLGTAVLYSDLTISISS